MATAGKAILMVEDNMVSQRMTANYLQARGYVVYLANHGRDALDFLEAHRVDLILMDLQMPEMDGYETSRMLRVMSDPYFRLLPIVAISSEQSAEIRQRIREAGMNDFVPKPFVESVLLDTIERNLMGIWNSSTSEEFPNLKIYSDGDPDFEAELKVLFVANLMELKSVVDEMAVRCDVGHFRQAVHKCKTTLTILDDRDVLAALTNLEEVLDPKEVNRPDVRLADRVAKFAAPCERLISKLKG